MRPILTTVYRDPHSTIDRSLSRLIEVRDSKNKPSNSSYYITVATPLYLSLCSYFNLPSQFLARPHSLCLVPLRRSFYMHTHTFVFILVSLVFIYLAIQRLAVADQAQNQTCSCWAHSSANPPKLRSCLLRSDKRSLISLQEVAGTFFARTATRS